MNEEELKPFYAKVHEVRKVSESTVVVKFDRGGLEFKPGQHLHVGPRMTIHRREYSIYSPADADYLEILVKVIDGGLVSPQLALCQPGDELYVKGPFGGFTLPENYHDYKYLFVATGTGLAPFRCLTSSHPELDYTLIHGVREVSDAYERHHYDQSRYKTCISRSNTGDYQGRVTQWVKENPLDEKTKCYICGNSDMIYEVIDILSGQGVPRQNMAAEIYF